MKRELIQLIIAIFALAFGGALEELAPKFLGVGFPILLSLAAYCATRRTAFTGALFAVAAGAAEDALCGLPFALSISYFTAVAGLLRGFKLPVACAVPAFCGYQLWLWIWLGNSLVGSVFTRLLVSVPLGAVTLAVVCWFMARIDRKAAVHEK